MSQVNQYDTATVAQFNRTLAGTTVDDGAIAELRSFMKDHEASSADASLQSLAGSLVAGGQTQAAAAITRTQSHADQTWKGSERDLQARSATPPADHSRRAIRPPARNQSRAATKLLCGFAAPRGEELPKQAARGIAEHA